MTRRSFLERLVLDRPETRAWALYDWANSAFFTTIVAAVFPVYYVNVAGDGLPAGEPLRRLALFTSLAMATTALIGPALGALADFAGARKRLFAVFLFLGVSATAGMFFVDRGDWLLGGVLLYLGTVGIVGSFVLYDALLPHVAREGEMDRLSATAYSLGYLGGGTLLALNILWIRRPDLFGLPVEEGSTLPARLAFLSVAVWWAVFSIPLLVRVPEPPRRLETDERAAQSAVRTAFRRLRETLTELRRYRAAFVMLLAALLYGEGIGTIIKLAGGYAAELGLGDTAIITALLITQFVGVPFAIFFGWLAGRIGTRPAISIALAIYVGVCVYAWFLDSEAEFYGLAIAVGTVQGGAQALTRSLFASLIPRYKSGEFFGFYAFASKLAGSVGPIAFAAIGEATSSNRYSIVSLAAFFLLGWLLLARVDIEGGRRAASSADREARVASQPT